MKRVGLIGLMAFMLAMTSAAPVSAKTLHLKAGPTVQTWKSSEIYGPRDEAAVLVRVDGHELAQRVKPPCRADYIGRGVAVSVKDCGAHKRQPLVIRYVSFMGDRKVIVRYHRKPRLTNREYGPSSGDR